MTPLLNLILVLTGGCNTTSPLPLPLNSVSVPFSLFNGNSSAISLPNCDCKCHGIPILPNICDMFQKLGLCSGQNTTANKTEEISTTLSSAISTTVSPEKKDVTPKNDTTKTYDSEPSLDISESEDDEDSKITPGETTDKNVTPSGDRTTEKFTPAGTTIAPKPSDRTPKEETTEPSKKEDAEKFTTEPSSEGIITPLSVTTPSPEKTSPKLFDSDPDGDYKDEDDQVFGKKTTADTSTTSEPLLYTKDGVTPAEETSKVPSEDDKKTTEPKSPEFSTKDSEDDRKTSGSTTGVTKSSHTTNKKDIKPSSGGHTDDDDASMTKTSDADATEDNTNINTATTPMDSYSKATPKTGSTDPIDKPTTEKVESPEKTSPKILDSEPGEDYKDEDDEVFSKKTTTDTSTTLYTKDGVTPAEKTSKVPSEDDKKTTEPKSPESPTKDSEDDSKMYGSTTGVTESSRTTAKKNEPSGGHTDDDDNGSKTTPSPQNDNRSIPSTSAKPKMFESEPGDLNYTDEDNENPSKIDRDDKISKTPEALTTTTESVPSEETPEPDLDNCLKVDKDTIDKLENITLQPLEKKTLKKIVKSINEFGLDLTEAVLRDNTTNYAIAPINFALLLLMAENGACKDTKKELDKTLHLSKEISKEELRPIKFLIDSLKDINETKLFLGDKIFLPQNVEISPEYRNLIQAAYQSDPLSVDYKKVNDVVEQINRWGANKTNNYVQRIISNTKNEVVSEDTSLLLAGVGYFQTNWVKSFDRLFNDHKLFYVGQNTYKSVCTMLQINQFYYYHMNYLPAEVIELPLKTNEDRELKMIVILPDEEKTLPDVLKNLHKFQYTDFRKHAKLEIVELSMPKFKIQSFIDLNNYSDKININKTIDDSNLCCVSKKAKISRILQKTVLKVNEGECAGPYYLCEGDDNSCMIHKIKFTANRPFIFFIIKDDTIIFSGQIIDPSHD